MKVALFTGDRAEYGLLEPVYDALQKEGLNPVWEKTGLLKTFMGGANYAMVTQGFDFAIVPCDRQEMVGVALALFYKNKPFAQLHAGDIGSDSHDEVGRWIISRCASIHFCNSPESAQNLIKSGEESWRVHIVGSTAFDNIEPELSNVVPRGIFNLVLINPDAYSRNETVKDLKDALKEIGTEELAVIIGPNHDENWQVVDQTWRLRRSDNAALNVNYLPDGVPRPSFLALMKYCKRFITNSSSALYELPMFDISKYTPIGKRNAERKPLGLVEPGGSKRIAYTIKKLDLKDPKLLRKKCV